MDNEQSVAQANVTNISWKEFFADRSWDIPPGEDHMRPAREALTPEQLQELMESYLTHGDYTSKVFGGNTANMASCDGCAILSPAHTRPWVAEKTYSNILPSAPTLSQANFMTALRHGQQNGISVPDTLIISGHDGMFSQARRIQTIMHDIHHWKLDICVSSALQDQYRYYWFLASRRDSGLHLRDCGHGYYEISAMRWDWIVASLSKTQPVSFDPT